MAGQWALGDVEGQRGVDHAQILRFSRGRDRPGGRAGGFGAHQPKACQLLWLCRVPSSAPQSSAVAEHVGPQNCGPSLPAPALPSMHPSGFQVSSSTCGRAKEKGVPKQGLGGVAGRPGGRGARERASFSANGNMGRKGEGGNEWVRVKAGIGRAVGTEAGRAHGWPVCIVAGRFGQRGVYLYGHLCTLPQLAWDP